MKLFGGLFGAKKGKGRKAGSKNKTADERLSLIKAKALEKLVGRHPELMDQIAMDALKSTYGMGVGEKSEVKQVVGFLKELKQAGLMDDARKAGENAWLRDILQPLGEGIGMFFVQMQQQQVAKANPVQVVVSPPSQQLPAPADVSPAPTPQAAPTPPPQDVPMTPVSAYLIESLEPLSPADAARWLQEQPYPQAKQLVNALRQTQNDDQAMQLMLSISQTAEPLTPLVAWLQTRWGWFFEVVAEIKKGETQAEPERRRNVLGI